MNPSLVICITKILSQLVFAHFMISFDEKFLIVASSITRAVGSEKGGAGLRKDSSQE